ncbi:unnamed protein product [Brassica oleracea]
MNETGGSRKYSPPSLHSIRSPCSNSSPALIPLTRVCSRRRFRTVGPDLSKKLEFTQGDLRNKGDIEKLFSKQRFDAVIYFAGLKAVDESVGNPRRYFDNKLVGTINLETCE